MKTMRSNFWVRIGLLLCLYGALGGPLALPLLAQTPTDPAEEATEDPAPPPPPPPTQEPEAADEDALLELDETLAGQDNCPPSTMTKILVAVLGLALLTVCYFLIVHLVERRYIQQDRSASLGRHVGFSISIAITGLGILGTYYGLTKCPFGHWWPWLLVGGGIWFVHLLYTLVVVRND